MSALSHTGPTEPQQRFVAALAPNDQFITALVFSMNTFGGAVLAVYTASWLELHEPCGAFLTVFIVAQPDGGLVKSFDRIPVAATGVLMTVALVFALAQRKAIHRSTLLAGQTNPPTLRGFEPYQAAGFRGTSWDIRTTNASLSHGCSSMWRLPPNQAFCSRNETSL